MCNPDHPYWDYLNAPAVRYATPTVESTTGIINDTVTDIDGVPYYGRGFGAEFWVRKDEGQKRRGSSMKLTLESSALRPEHF